MLKIRNLFILSAVAAAVSLTACGGGGDDPVQTINDIPAVAVSAATVATAKAAAHQRLPRRCLP